MEKAARCSCSAGCLSCCAQPIQPKASAVQRDSGQTPEPLSCFPLRITKPLTGGEGTHARPSSCSINLYPAHFPALRMSRALLCAAGRVRVGSAPALATCVYEAGRAGRAPPAAPHPCPAPLPPARQAPRAHRPAPRSDHLQRSPRVSPPVPQEMSCCRAVPRQAPEPCGAPEPQGRGHPQPSLHLPARAARGRAAPSRPLCAPVMCHCQRRGAQLLLGAGAHLHVYEHGGAAQVGAGLRPQRGAGAPCGDGGLLLPSSGCRGRGEGSGPARGWRWKQGQRGRGGQGRPPPALLPGRRWPGCTPRRCRTCPTAPSTWSSWSWPSARPTAAGTIPAPSSSAWRTRTARRGAGCCPSPTSSRWEPAAGGTEGLAEGLAAAAHGGTGGSRWHRRLLGPCPGSPARGALRAAGAHGRGAADERGSGPGRGAGADHPALRLGVPVLLQGELVQGGSSWG